nr:hypothetical protein GCM10020093_100460 [Planobispora longispora]
MRELSQTELLHELEPVVAGELNRHISTAKEWFPHEYIPWSEGRDYDGIFGGEAWSETDSTIPEEARVSLIVNLLTEDNLPSYHHEIATTFGRDAAWGTWVHRWTAEEGRHGTAIRDYLTVTRAVDPVALERARMVHMGEGFTNSYEGCCTRWPTSPSRSWPPASRTATPARPPATRTASACSPRSRPTRTCTCSSTGTCSTRPSSSPRARPCAP